jgi:uncharacterized protein
MSDKKIIWVLQGVRAGDNAQARELASLLDAEMVTKELTFNMLHHLPNVMLGASAASLTENAQRALLAPWPEMVIGTGKRAAPVARWIKKQSGGRTKIIHLGRPRAPLSAFDLVITTPQYGLPRDPNVLVRSLPFASPRNTDAGELRRWRDTWKDLPRPLIGVAIGNAKHPLRFGPPDVGNFAARLNQLGDDTKGSLLLLASPRTQPSLVEALAAALHVPHMSYGVFDKTDNPYQVALATADRFVVTSDSVSMISELMNTGKPVDVFELPTSWLKFGWSATRGLGAWASRNGILQPPRDVPGMVRQLIESGAVGRLGGDHGDKIPSQVQEALIPLLNGWLKP